MISISGSSPGLVDLLPVSNYSAIASNLLVNLTNTIIGGEKVFTTVTCFNGAKLYTTYTSDGVVLVSNPPNADSAAVNVIRSAETWYATDNDYQSETDQIRAYWNGFVDPAGIAFYEVR